MSSPVQHWVGVQQTPSLGRSLSWVLAILLLIVSIYVSGVKPIGISADLRNYELLYNTSAISDWMSIFQAGDAGYFALAKLAATVGWSFDAFAFAMAATTCILLFVVASRLNTNRWVLVALYFSYLFWLHEYTQIRIAAAIAIALYAKYVASPAWRWPLLLIGSLLHNSLILLVVALALVRIRDARTAAIVGLGAASITVALLLMGSFTTILTALVQRIVTYQDLASTTGQFSSINLFSLMPLVQILGIGYAAVRFRTLSSSGREEVVLSTFGVVAFYALSAVPVLAFRTFELFLPFFVILLSRLSRHSIVIWAVIFTLIALGVRSSFLAVDSVVIL